MRVRQPCAPARQVVVLDITVTGYDEAVTSAGIPPGPIAIAVLLTRWFILRC
jgi:hypothetical protein